MDEILQDSGDPMSHTYTFNTVIASLFCLWLLLHMRIDKVYYCMDLHKPYKLAIHLCFIIAAQTDTEQVRRKYYYYYTYCDLFGMSNNFLNRVSQVQDLRVLI